MRTHKLTKGMAVAAALFLAFGLAAQTALAKEKYEEKFEKIEALARDGKVILRNVSGRIGVKSWDQDQVKIEALKVAEANTLEKAKENAAKVEIDVTKTGNIVQIETKYPKISNLNVSVHYTLTIPAKASITVKSVSGNVNASDIGGAFEGNITSGNATLARIAGGVDCKTLSGQIKVEDVPAACDLKTVSGSIEATKIKGSVQAETTSGPIVLRDISEPKSVRAKVLSGRITYEGQIMPGGKYEFETLSGSIHLAIPANSAFELDAESFSGSIDSEFKITMEGKFSAKELRGIVNDGGATLRLKTFSGSIELKQK
jgi:hypothetical protein